MFIASSNQTPINGTSFSAGSSLDTPKKNIIPALFTVGVVLLSVCAGGLVAYAYHLRDGYQAVIEEKKKELSSITYAQDVSLQTMEEFSIKTKGVATIFDNAPSARSIFNIFESAIGKNVYFGKMQASRVEGTKSYKITVSGTARSLDDIQLQKLVFQTPAYAKYVSNVMIPTYSKDAANGTYVFTMSFMTTVGRFSTADLTLNLTKPDEVEKTTVPEVKVETKKPQDLVSPVVIATPVVSSPKSSSSTAVSEGTKATSISPVSPILIPKKP